MNGTLTVTQVSHEPDSADRPPIVNAVTVDVEDWIQSVIDPDLPLTDRFRSNTRKVLDTLARHGVKGTFFVLGLAAEKAPDLVREIDAAGHEVQSHGYGHRWVHTQTPQAFREDIERSKKLLEDLIGRPITGYRAPAFTIMRESLWALDVLAECGFAYDSSIFPLRARRYGITGAPWYPHRLRTAAGHELIEIPVASYRCLGRRLPAGGGGYFRLLPCAVARRAIRQINRAGHAATIYMHPHEFSPDDFRSYSRRIPWPARIHQGLGRRGFPRKIDRLLTGFPFSTLRALIAAAARLPLHGDGPEPKQARRPSQQSSRGRRKSPVAICPEAAG
jgi:polysaccharide deacetylase family protein (PEP-CTERM system associated)